MKPIKLTTIFILLTYFQVNSQADLNLTELKAPSSPAFTILGVQPTEVSRPTSFDAFKASLFNDFTSEDGIALPQNLALEFSPFWLFSHEKLTFEKVLNTTDIGNNILRNSSFSVATVDINDENTNQSIGTRMGIGYRTMIFKGSASDANKEKLKKAVNTLNQTQIMKLGVLAPLQAVATDNSLTTIDDLINAIKIETQLYLSSQNLDKSDEDSIRDNIENLVIPWLELQKNKNALSGKTVTQFTQSDLIPYVSDKLGSEDLSAQAAAVQKLISGDKYQGFFLEFAASLALDFDQSKFDDSRVSKWGLWLTPSYRLEDESFEFLGVIRYLRDESVAMMESDNFDLGAKIVFERNRFSFSGECIQRFQDSKSLMTNSSESESDFKAVVNIEYKLTNTILLTYTFGENFEVNTGNTDSLVSSVGLSYTIGGNTKKIKLFEN